MIRLSQDDSKGWNISTPFGKDFLTSKEKNLENFFGARRGKDLI
jgi:hypothetical protein